MLTDNCYTEPGLPQLNTGDNAALLAIYQTHYTCLINYGYRICGDKDLSNDCIIKILLRLWEQRNSLPDIRNMRSYLLTSLKHELGHALQSQHYRHRQLQQFCALHAETELSYEDIVIQLQSDKELKKRLSRAFECLTAREKELLQMRFYEDKSYDEIAHLCAITKRTAYNIIHGALQRLKKELHRKNMNPAELSALLFTAVIFLLS